MGAACPVGGLIVTPEPSDLALVSAYRRMESEITTLSGGDTARLLDVVFYEDAPSLESFIELSRRATATLVGCECLNSDSATVVGISWINALRGMGSGMVKGEIGFCFFDGLKPFKKMRLARQMRDWAFGLGLDVLFGTTPQQNVNAIRFSRLLGFDTSSQVRNYTTWRGHLTDVVVSSMTRAKWEELRHGGA